MRSSVRCSLIFGSLEGTCRDLDPDFDYSVVAPIVIDGFMTDVDFLDAKAREDFGDVFFPGWS